MNSGIESGVGIGLAFFEDGEFITEYIARDDYVPIPSVGERVSFGRHFYENEKLEKKESEEWGGVSYDLIKPAMDPSEVDFRRGDTKYEVVDVEKTYGGAYYEIPHEPDLARLSCTIKIHVKKI